MDKIKELLKELKADRTLWEYTDPRGQPRRVEYSGKFLDTVGEVLERYGFGVTWTFLQNKEGREISQAIALKKVLKKLENCPQVVANRAIGRFIIKTLNEVQRMEV